MASFEVEPGVFKCACGCGGHVAISEKQIKTQGRVNWYVDGHQPKVMDNQDRTGPRFYRKAKA